MKTMLIQGAKRLRRVSVYGLALIAGLISAWAVREHVQNRVDALEAEARTPVVQRLVAAYDLPAGTLLEEMHLAVRDIPAQWAPSASQDPLALNKLLGGTLIADVAHGEPVLKTQLTFLAPTPPLASRLQSGQRALTVAAADLGGLTGMLRADDLIDIYVTFPHRERELTVPLLQGMRVLTVGGESDGEGGGTGVITLAADPGQAMKFVAARQAGTLTALVRHRDDAAAVAASADSDLATLLGLAPEPAPTPGIAILYGDRVDASLAELPVSPPARSGFGSERP